MSRDPFAREPLRVTIASERVTLPYQPAAGWIGAICGSATTAGALLPLLADPDRARTITRLARGTLAADTVAAALYEALRAAVSELAWWETYRLLVLSTQPSAAGRMLLAGLDPWQQPPAAWCYALYELMTQGVADKDRFRFDAQLKTPPAGVDEDFGDMDFDQMVAAARATPGMG
ncbi:hypothetical protein [Streptomyces drozdowiczii]|uniref:Uncharacterized protein n=1 Tax=Streptomyces drozdowiczii TaxID=202862 RepID=A0ABY6PQ39_9ACTN|nr:hypothetical protein [Streptomyces drozdowiczii]MCX0246407.1 hypothetical protein [Streptomyces drozdowiczii]UZK54089.1 hypothetical protein NEH16_07915 [Streptomyces drozdowiczii]